METLQYLPHTSNTRSPVMNIVLKTPGSTPRHVRLIGGYPFEAFILNRKRYIIPHLCESCEEIRDDLVEISDDITQLSSKQTGNKDPRSQLDPDISPWSTDEPIFTSLFDSHGFGITWKDKDSDNHQIKSERKYYTGFRQGNSQNTTPRNWTKKPVVLKYSHKGVNPYSKETTEESISEEVDGSSKSYQIPEDVSYKNTPFHYVDSRLQALPKPANRNSYEKKNITITIRNSNDFYHYDQSHLYIEQYKTQKHISRSAKDNRQSKSTSSLPPTLPKLQLPASFHPGWEFWETFDTAGNKTRSRLGDGYTVAQSNGYTSLPKVDVTKESMMNLTIMEVFKREQKLAKKKEKHEDFYTRQKKLLKQKETQNNDKTNNAVNAPPVATYYGGVSLHDYPTLKGRTAPKHFMDNFNTLKVKTTSGKILRNEKLEKVLHHQDNCGITIRHINNDLTDDEG